MKTHLFSLLILVNLSTNIFAMDELFDTDHKQNLKDFSAWIHEHPIPTKYKIASGIATLGISASLVTKNKKYAVGACGLSGCLVLYEILLSESETDKALLESREKLAESQQQLQNSVDSLCGIITSYKESSKEITTILEDQNKKLENLLVAVGEQSGKIDTLQKKVTTQNSTLGEIAADLNECKDQSTRLVKGTLNLQQSAPDSTKTLEEIKNGIDGLSSDIATIHSGHTKNILKELSKTLIHDSTKNRTLQYDS